MIKNIGYFKDYSDDTIKGVYQVNNKKIIEVSMLYNRVDRDVICVPTHHYCNLGCKMCHLTNSKVIKPMQKIKSDDLIYCISDMLKKYKTDKRKLLISFMGVGEPLLNITLIENIYKIEDSIKLLGYDYIGYSLSTMMPNNNLIELAKLVDELNIPLKVHFSMHSPIDKIRDDLIPSSKVKVHEGLNMLLIYSYVFKKNKVIMDKYKKVHNSNMPVEIHYTLIAGVNDSNKELNELIKLLKEYQIPIKFIKFNPVNKLIGSDKETMWLEIIKGNLPDLKVKIYTPPGREVGSSCGEFTKHYYLEEIETKEQIIEFNRWIKKHLIKN